MAGSFSQLYIHLVFAVRNRKNLIVATWEEELYKYITGIITNKGQKLYAINGMPDHIHILISIKASCYIPDLVREIKKSTNQFIREKGFCKSGFNWQAGFSATSHSRSNIPIVARYIENQKIHHSKTKFIDEYKQILEDEGVEYNERYLFDPTE